MGRPRQLLAGALALGVATIVVGSFLLLATIAPVAGAAPVPLSKPPGPTPSGSTDGAPPAPTPSPATAASAPLNVPTAGQVTQTVLDGLDTAYLPSLLNPANGTIAGNVAYRTADWAVGSPVVLTPPTVPRDVVWYPTYPNAPVSSTLPRYPQPSTAPVLEYFPENTTLNGTTMPPGFFGVIPSLVNTSALAFDPNNGLVYATQPLNNSVAVFNPSSLQSAHAPIPVGIDPSAIVYDPQNHTLFVANEGSDNVTVINATTETVVVNGVPVGSSPTRLTLVQSDSEVFVVNANSDNITVVNSSSYREGPPVTLTGPASDVAYSNASGNIIVTIPSSHLAVLYNASSLGPTGLAQTGLGATSAATCWDGWGFLVTDNRTNSFSTWNSTTGGLAPLNGTIPTGVNPTGIAMVPDQSGNALIWNEASRSVTFVNLSIGRVISNATGHDIWPGPAGLAYSPSTNQLFVANARDGSIAVLNPITLQVSLSIPNPIPEDLVGGRPVGLALNDSSHLLYVGATDAVDAINYSASTATLEARYANSGTNIALTLDNTSNRLWLLNNETGLIALYANNLTLANSVGLAKGNSTETAIALDPMDDDLYVVNHTSGAVSVVSGATGAVLVPAISNAGTNDTSATYDPADNCVYVLGNEITIINATSNVAYATPVTIPYHYVSWSIMYDPSREFVYALTTFGIPALSGNLTAIDGSSVAAGWGSSISIPVGQFPVQALSLPTPKLGSFPEAHGQFNEIWITNYESGTLSVVASPLGTPSVTATPNPDRVGQPFSVRITVTGGSGPLALGPILSSGPTGRCGGGASGLSLYWNCTPNAPGTVNLTIKIGATVGGPLVAVSVQVYVYASLVATAAIGGVTLPATVMTDTNASVSFNSTASLGVAPYNFTWWVDGLAVAYTNNFTTSFPSIGTNTVNLVVTDSVGEYYAAVGTVDVMPNPSGHIVISPVGGVDVGQPVNLTAVVSGGVGTLVDDWTVQGGTSGTGLSTVQTWSTAGTWNVTFHYEDSFGRGFNATTQVTVYPALGATESYVYNGSSTTSPVVGYSVQFSAAPSGGKVPYTVSWSFGDGSNASGSSVRHLFASAGTFLVSFKVTDSTGAAVSGSLPLTVVAVAVKPPTSSSTSSSTSDLEEGLILGLIVGAAVAAGVVYLADRSRRRARPPPPPSAYVPPAAVAPEPVHPWKED